MGFFKIDNRNEENKAKIIAKQILEEEDRMRIIFEIFGELPTDLVEWVISTLNLQGKSKGYSEIDLAKTLCSTVWLPGDLVIRKNRDPRPGDIIEAGQRFDENYQIMGLKVLKLNVKDGTAYVQSLTDPEGKGLISLGQITGVIDRVISFNSPEWKKLIQILNIEHDEEEIKSWVKDNLDELKKLKEFHDRENNIKKLESRLKELK